MQISKTDNNSQNFCALPINKKIIHPIKDNSVDFSDDVISKRAIKLVKGMNDYIEDLWAQIKKGELDNSALSFILSGQKGEVVTIRPVYGANKPIILMDLDDGKTTQRFLFDRKKPANFTYEKFIITDFGSATLKSFDSTQGKNPVIENIADEKLRKYIPKILPYKYICDQLGYFNEYSKSHF